MILKDMDYKVAKCASLKAGQQQEKDVAFYLRRAFKDDAQIFVLNDFKFTYNNETAQIDHLILYRFGFVLVESKSITGNITVNKQEEWSRSYRGHWQGMPSPIKQIQLQAQLLKDLLHENRSNLMGKFLGLQQTLGKRSWDHLCAVSSNAIIERDNMPSSVSKKLVKSEFLVDSIVKIMDLKSDVVRTLSLIDNRPAFNDDELIAIRDFLLSQCKGNAKQLSNETLKVQSIDDVYQPPKEKSSFKKVTSPLACKNCKETTLLTPLSGKYGYYVKCGVCKANTPLKRQCGNCNSKETKVSKKGYTYTLKCSSCAHEELLLTKT